MSSDQEAPVGIEREEFEHQLRGALRSIHDYVTLRSHPLAALISGDTGADEQSRVRRFRRALLEAIEGLAPPADSPIGQRQWRGYHILTSRYVEGRTSEETWHELAISERQYYREQQAALQVLYDRLWAVAQRRLQETAPAHQDEPPAPSTLDSELERLARVHDSVDLSQLLTGVVAAICPLAESRRVRLTKTANETLPTIQSNRTVLRQVFIRVLSSLVVIDEMLAVSLCTDFTGRRAWVTIRTEMSAEPSAEALEHLREQFAEAKTLTKRVRGEWRDVRHTPSGYEIAVGLPADSQRVILAVEDNPSAIQLMRRYLASEEYRIVHAESGEEALAKAREVPPDVITLDIMLPNQDGWEILQQLQAEPELADVPIILASVLAEPALTTTFNVAGYLKKPYTRQDLVSMLETILGEPS